MIVLQVTGSYSPATHYTGPPQQLHQLCKELRAIGVDVRVLATNANGPQILDVPVNRWTEHEGVPVFYGRALSVPAAPDLSWGTWRELRRAVPSAHVVHVTALFSWMNIAVAAYSDRRTPYVVSPRGSLAPTAMAFNRLRKAAFFGLGGHRALRRAAAIHVTSAMEAAHVESFAPGLNTFIVPNGVVLPSDEDLRAWRAGREPAPTIVFLGRLHPHKNLLGLVEAWVLVQARRPEARLVLAGPDDRGHRTEIERRIASLGLGASVKLAGRVDGDAKHRLIATATCLILPSRGENFGNVVAEALAYGVPVIASTGTPWEGLKAHDCGIWAEPTVGGLGEAMVRILDRPAVERDAMGTRGRLWMAGEFAWPALARRMADAYASIVANTSRRTV